jgi:mannose/fructose/N-acetylgalactosamine-specific phosphotransferase system component IID
MLFSSSSIVVTSTGTIEILISRGSTSKLFPSISGLIGFVITIGCFYLEKKMWEVTQVVLVLVSISILKKSDGTYSNFGKVV